MRVSQERDSRLPGELSLVIRSYELSTETNLYRERSPFEESMTSTQLPWHQKTIFALVFSCWLLLNYIHIFIPDISICI